MPYGVGIKSLPKVEMVAVDSEKTVETEPRKPKPAAPEHTGSLSSLEFYSFRKFNDLRIEFCPGLNLISGINGTGKSSLLYLISNSFKAVQNSDRYFWVKDKSAHDELGAIKKDLNPKVETLTRSSKFGKAEDSPTGILFKATYDLSDGSDYELQFSFRRHKESDGGRFALKPKYIAGASEKLPSTPVAYLGLARLVPYGELNQNEQINASFSNRIIDRVTELYKRFTGLEISNVEPSEVTGLKTRGSFRTQQQGVDSNTISAGQENIFIILRTLATLETYSMLSEGSPSILLVDEIDATLHPTLQILLLEVLRSSAKRYNIQVIFTTHSYTLVEETLRKKDNVIYLDALGDNTTVMSEPTLPKITMKLYTKSASDIYIDKKFYVITEDAEAEHITKLLFDFIAEKDPGFRNISGNFEFVATPIGADSLIKFFSYQGLWSKQAAFGIVDGDKQDEVDKLPRERILALPGGDSPERFLFQFAQQISKDETLFWTDRYVNDAGFDPEFYRLRVEQDYYDKLGSNGSLDRKAWKKHFNRFIDFYTLIFKYWLSLPDNLEEVGKFYHSLRNIYLRTYALAGLPKDRWEMPKPSWLESSGRD